MKILERRDKVLRNKRIPLLSFVGLQWFYRGDLGATCKEEVEVRDVVRQAGRECSGPIISSGWQAHLDVAAPVWVDADLSGCSGPSTCVLRCGSLVLWPCEVGFCGRCDVLCWDSRSNPV
ncbi:unnamed protein product [Microthlaspi erraticum]|uniref:Uncharacterized protein n=1 Tax=Microthlaspi erraticum TaxID=1685480 RepID=A0A6D2HFY1_9BRAS|nr:unnamed protein product [Microthlaspi erraticum]